MFQVVLKEIVLSVLSLRNPQTWVLEMLAGGKPLRIPLLSAVVPLLS